MRALIIPVTLILTGLEMAAWSFIHDSTGTSTEQALSIATLNPVGMMMHGGAAVGMAILGSAVLRGAGASSRWTLGFLCLILAGILPFAGVPASGLLLFILSKVPTRAFDPEERFVFGNPEATAARRGSRHRHPELRTLAEASRLLTEDQLAMMIHGLRGLNPPRQTRHLLACFSHDSQAELQFAAQGVMATHVESLEGWLKELKQRISLDPQDTQSRLDAASVLLALTEWISPGDATASVYIEEARDLMCEVAPSPKFAPINSRLAILLNNATAARKAMHHTIDPLLEMQAAFAAGEWVAVDTAAADIAVLPLGHAEAVAFWLGHGIH